MTATEHIWQGIRWPVHRRALITADNVGNVIPTPWIWPRSIYGEVGWLPAKFAHIRDVLATHGGFFSEQEEKPVRDYDLADPNCVDQFFERICKIDARDPEAITQLINEWGPLGVRSQFRLSEEELVYTYFGGRDSLRAITNQLELFQQHIRWLQALQTRDAIALRKAGMRDALHRVADRKERWNLRWLEFSRSLEQHMSVHLVIRCDSATEVTRQVWILRCPMDVAWAKLWNLATQPERLRQCKNKACRRLFVATDPRKRCCSRACSKRKAASDWYWTLGGRNRRKRQRGRTRRSKRSGGGS